MSDTDYDQSNGDYEADTTPAQTSRRKSKRERAIEEGYDPTLVPKPPPYPLDEALEDAYEPDPLNDEKADIISKCQPDHPPQPAEHEQHPEGIRERATANQEQPTVADIREPEHGQSAEHPEQQQAEPLAIAGYAPASSEPLARARPPESLGDQLQRLPQWQARYVLALMEYGGVIALACRKVNVSRQSVENAQAASPEFARASADAVAHATDLVEAAVFRGATIGDTAPVYQGGLLVGYKRVRNTKDAELLLKLRGKIDAPETPEASRRAAGRQPVAAETVAAVVAGTLKALFDARATHHQQP
jgi:hypothetical protein